MVQHSESASYHKDAAAAQVVKSVASANRKVYMEYDVEPSREITGGAWCALSRLVLLAFAMLIAGLGFWTMWWTEVMPMQPPPPEPASIQF